MTPIQYSRMQPGDESRISAFVSRVFHQFVAPGFSPEGIDAFMQYIQPEALQHQLRANHFALIAESGNEIAGVIEIRDFSHVALFFVASRFQRRGIGKGLFHEAVEICRSQDAKVSQITVNASPNSVKAYARLGFKPTDKEQCVNGIRFVPMTCNLKSEKTVA